MTRRSFLVIGLSLGLAMAAGGCGPSSSPPGGTAGLDEDEQQALLVERRTELVRGLLKDRHTVPRLLNELDAAFSGGVRLTECAYTRHSGEVRIKGRTPTNSLLADAILRLETGAVLKDVTLQATVQKRDRGAVFHEFTLRAVIRDASLPTPGSRDIRNDEIEKRPEALPETAEALRMFQRLALESGLQMTGFSPGDKISGEFYTEWPVKVEVTGSLTGLRRYFGDLAEADSLWIVEKLSFSAVSPRDDRSPVRASFTAQATMFD